MFKSDVFRRKQLIKGAAYPFLIFKNFVSEERLKGPKGVKIRGSKVWGLWGMLICFKIASVSHNVLKRFENKTDTTHNNSIAQIERNKCLIICGNIG